MVAPPEIMTPCTWKTQTFFKWNLKRECKFKKHFFWPEKWERNSKNIFWNERWKMKMKTLNRECKFKKHFFDPQNENAKTFFWDERWNENENDERSTDHKREWTNRKSRAMPQWIVVQWPLSALTAPGAFWIVFPGFQPSYPSYDEPSRLLRQSGWMDTCSKCLACSAHSEGTNNAASPARVLT